MLSTCKSNAAQKLGIKNDAVALSLDEDVKKRAWKIPQTPSTKDIVQLILSK